MHTGATTTRSSARSRPTLLVVFALAMSSISLNVWANTLKPVDYRLLASTRVFDDTFHVSITYRLRPPRRLRATHLEIAVSARASSPASVNAALDEHAGAFASDRVQPSSDRNPNSDPLGIDVHWQVDRLDATAFGGQL